ncbi:MAG: murein biosynthesis integral membrane protein MurJ [Candidatus Buchananbacteria bacterium]
MIKVKLKNLFSSQSKTITSAAILLGAASLVSRLFGVLRDRVLAGQFGAGGELDVYYAAFRIPDLIFNLLILGSLSAGFIPVFTSLVGSNKNKAWELVNVFFNFIILTVFILSALMVATAPWLVKIITPGFSPEQLATTTKMTQIMFFSLMFLAMSGIFGSVLQSLKSFFIYSIAPILYNIGIIIGAIFFVPILGIYGLAWGVVLGAFMHMLIQIVAAWTLGYRWRWRFDLGNKGLRKILTLMVPRTMGIMVSQINFLVVTIIGSTLAAGSIAVFNLANNIQSFPLGLFGVSFAVAAFPTLSEAVNNKKKFIQALSLTIRQILFLVIPASVLLIVLRAQVVRVILGSGKFDWNDTLLTLQVLSIFAVSLFAQSCILVLARAYYAQQDTKTPFVVGLVTEVINFILAVSLSRWFGVMGLAAAFSLSTIINFLLLAIILRQRFGSMDGMKILISFSKICVAAFMMAIVAQAIKYPMQQWLGLQTFIGVASQTLAAGSAGLVTYFTTCWLIKSEEFKLFIEVVNKKILKKPQLPEEVTEQESLTQNLSS